MKNTNIVLPDGKVLIITPNANPKMVQAFTKQKGK